MERLRRKVLVIGGGSFIGRHLIARLKQEDVEIRVLGRSSSFPDTSGIEYVSGDFRDPSVTQRCLDGVHAVYHLANPIGRNWEQYASEVVEPTMRVAELAAAAGVRQFFYASSIDLYDSAYPQSKVTGTTSSDPSIIRRNHYARAKDACERSLLSIDGRNGLRVTIFRLGLTIGKGSSPAHRGVGHFSSAIKVRFWGRGDHRLPFVLVEDAVDAFVLALDNAEAAGRTLLLSAPPSLSAREYMEAVAARAYPGVSYRAHPIVLFWAEEALKECVKTIIRHPNRRVASLHDWQCRAHRANYDPSETEQVLGWRPAGDRETLIRQGIHPAVDEFINGPRAASEMPL
ncbi:MAG TPA: NAD(P)-dependent oxidoreductase [Novosphingobium sp.]|nr:NAD(P)-dependent oxidoreductase [Novosphingobium sp.]